MNKSIFLIALIYLINKTNAKLTVSDYFNPLDRELHQRVLNPEQCRNQLNFIRFENPSLLAQFTDAGLRIPRGILQGNLKDYGNYPQCFAIHEDVEDMSIQGKFCLINVPVNINLERTTESVSNFDLNMLQLPLNTKQKLEERNVYMGHLRSIFGNSMGSERIDADSPLPNIAFELGLCIPKVCTTEEAISGNLFNVTDIGFQYNNVYCRLPNDRHWVPADYIAIVIFSLLGILTLLSTSYDVYHNVIYKQDTNSGSVVLSMFSVYTNCRRLLLIKSNPNVIECLDGIRTLATLWVVIGHVFYIFNFFPANTLEAIRWIQSYDAIMISTALLSVDTFFMMSGLLLVYTTAHKFTGCQLLKNIIPFYLNRLLRMFPVLAAVILFEASIYNRLGDGPMWTVVFGSVERCRTFWWSTLLHLQNFVNPEEVCIGVTWYLAIDVQLHILSPIVLFWVLGREKRLAWATLFFALLISLTASTVFIFTNEFSNEGLKHFIYVYVNILTRAPPFFVGMIYGYALHLTRGKKIRMSIKLHAPLTAFSISLMALIMYCHYIRDNQLNDKIMIDVLESFLRPFWAAGLGWIIYASYTGIAVPINWLLSLNIWKIPSRISYAIYLIHFSIIVVVYSNALQPIYFTVERAMFHAMAFTSITLILSFLITIIIDAPFGNLIRLLLGIFNKKPIQKEGKRDEICVTRNSHAFQDPDKNLGHQNGLSYVQKL